jgi:hypothetical protein
LIGAAGVPDIADYARDGISDWNDFVETANLVRAALGVSQTPGSKPVRSWGGSTPRLPSRQSFNDQTISHPLAAICER